MTNYNNFLVKFLKKNLTQIRFWYNSDSILIRFWFDSGEIRIPFSQMLIADIQKQIKGLHSFIDFVLWVMVLISFVTSGISWLCISEWFNLLFYLSSDLGGKSNNVQLQQSSCEISRVWFWYNSDSILIRCTSGFGIVVDNVYCFHFNAVIYEPTCRRYYTEKWRHLRFKKIKKNYWMYVEMNY